MTVLHDPVALLQKNLDEWSTPYVELDIFATDSAQEIADIINTFCREQLGSRLAGYLFHSASVGSTHGVQLEDRREVVIKARPPASTNPYLKHDRQSLETICQVMGWLHARAYPCPKVLLGPTPLGQGLATVEEFFERGAHGDAFQPDCRRTIACGLAELIEMLRSFPADVSCLQHFQRGASLYPQPHGKIFNFENTAAGAEWIDDFARRARQIESHDGTRVLGHADWCVEHLRFQDGRIVATYDWDSLAFRPETDLVGVSAHGFTADWSLTDVRRIPTGADIHAYVADYEHSRGLAFLRRERQAVFASCVYWIAYGARCTHSLQPNTKEWAADTWPYLLRTEGEALLAEATG
jgi:hypothetical protein